MPDRRPRGPVPAWRPHGQTLRVLAAVDDVLDRYAAQLPLSLRQIFYVLVSDEILPKTERAYKNLCEHLGMARRSGRLDWSVIRDDTQVVVQAPASFADPADFWRALRGAAEEYRRNRQDGQPVRLELWCETAGMVPQLARIGAEYGLPTYSGGGFDGLAGKHDAAERAAACGVETVVLHVGDLDPSGIHLFSALAEDVAAFAAAAGGRIRFERIAVTTDQVERYALPTAPPKASDRRSFTGTTTTQAEALPPDVLAAVVRAAIEAHRDPDVHQAALAREEAERSALRHQLDV
ncbi:hypothetical protein [Saccharopolyspora taberi]|uniref:hypothetical protein n=1 Tax=Saccharopolyspora taberi TaxID=60895 RepID=UPI0031CE8643